jgi:hypothetical protein
VRTFSPNQFKISYARRLLTAIGGRAARTIVDFDRMGIELVAIAKGFDVKRWRSERISRHAPYGWDFGPDGLLVENALEQRELAWIQGLHDQGKSLRVIAEMLNTRGVEPKRAKRWRHSSVLRIVSRTV